MSVKELRVGDIGTEFVAAIRDQDGAIINISASLVRRFLFRKPDGTSMIKTAVFTTDGTDGLVEYVTIADDVDQAGEWGWQAFIRMAAGEWRTNIHPVAVYANIDELLHLSGSLVGIATITGTLTDA